MSSFKVLPVQNTQVDRDQVAKVLITAMSTDAYYLALYPHTPLPELIHYSSLRLGINLQKRLAWSIKSVLPSPDPLLAIHDPDSHDVAAQDKPQQSPPQEQEEEMISYARYVLPERLIQLLEEQNPRRPLSVEERAQYEREARLGCDGDGEPRGMSVGLVEVVGPAMEKARKAFPAGREIITLDMLATLPSHQGTGSASQLVRWGTELADREGLVMVLEATDGKEGFYSRFGFQKVSEAKHDLRSWGGHGFYTHVFMVREPRMKE